MATPHRYYRLYIHDNNGGTYTGLHGLEMATSVGGANIALAANGTGSGSSTGQGIYPPSNAFDNNGSTYWVGVTNADEWLAFDFGDGNEKDIQEFRILQAVYGGIGETSTVKNADFQHSDDGVTWTTRVSIVNPGTSGTRTYFGSVGNVNVSVEVLPPYVSISGGGRLHPTSPLPTLLAYFSGTMRSVTAPRPTLTFKARSSYGENAAFITAPKPALSAHFGGNVDAAASAPSLTFEVTGTALLNAAITAPAGAVASEVTATTMASVQITAPRPNLVGYGGAVCSITLTGRPTVEITGTGGGVASVAITAPLFELTASVTAQNHGSLIITAPAGRLVTGAQVYIVAPMAQLTAIGTATITATYEAYALNLKHTPRRDGLEPVDEMTHYTNFPFTHIVRYKNSYYGANSTGLYLLEGTTDNGAAIPWSAKTHLTDLGYPEKKTVVSAYFGGRLGPAETVTLAVGENGDETYSYTTPRGPAAQNYRQKFGRGVKTRYFGLGLSGTQDFTLDTVDLEIDKLTRRI